MRYDNEVGKGDHRHFSDKERVYRFGTPDKLIADFQRDMRGGTVKIVTLDVRDPGGSMNDFVRVWKTAQREKSARISFVTGSPLEGAHRQALGAAQDVVRSGTNVDP